MMKKPYIKAFILPFLLSPAALCFKKKLTVIGIIGKTHGVNVTKIPAKRVPKNNNQRLISSDFSSVLTSATATFSVAASSCLMSEVVELAVSMVVSVESSVGRTTV